MNFDNIEDLYNHIEKNIKNNSKIVEKEVKNELVKQMEYIYDEYIPQRYERRYKHGGYADERNVKVDKVYGEGYININMENTTLANGRDEGKRLDEIIEEGRYQYSPSPSARPVFRRTDKILNKNKLIYEKELIKNL